ncbi:BZ3500_MvSof-1268-A1-R1_Chr9g10444 [Microbotryum saponariae]|uniref:BZ3500_MvSof-1268-A1-R1_Chr9g10444 protein n=1 Tax=Microbotryum saponariae TaxID=289078 RepID=A0A2X0MZM8_9BASI|nr:BZ3501_MvSof-1269-A2-R1_Chr9g10194 [Microbotryum saponariae]SDA00102.1 BZ3500_MvSof-1268-A1-R1_Chr9g10444 [Microbotryum saponariae]
MSSLPAASSAPGQTDQSYKAIVDYLTKRGHLKAVAELQTDLANSNTSAAAGNTTAGSATGPGNPSTSTARAGAAASSSSSHPPSPAAALNGGGKAVGLDDFAHRNAPSQPTSRAQTGGAAGERRGPDQAVAAGQMLADPPSWEKGYEGLTAFVHNSLDIHRPELQPILLPLFVHAYLDLVLVGYRKAADQFMNRFGPHHTPSDPHVVRMLSSIRNADHVKESEEATRWRKESYNIRLSERGWGLLLGWLQGGGLALSLEGTESRGRDRVLAIINERVKVDAMPGPPSKTPTGYGLLSDFAGKEPSSKALDPLKLGPAPVDPNLEREVARQVKDDAAQDAMDTSTPSANGINGSTSTSEPKAGPGSTPLAIDFADASPHAENVPLINPVPSDMLPMPQTLRTIDVMREVEKVREARKRIKLSAEAYVAVPATTTMNGANGDKVGVPLGQVTEAAKPSVCIFTIHDAGDRSFYPSLTTTAFSDDSTMMAAAFSDSYIRLWSLKGGKLQAFKNDLNPDEVKEGQCQLNFIPRGTTKLIPNVALATVNDLKKIREKAAPTSRKLIGHSGPVYALSFDPVPGPSGPPRYLLSASQDATVRLWSLETFTNLVAYRGHREPVWDVEWGPRGIYFATASRDRTARLWSSDKTHALRIFAGHLSDVNTHRLVLNRSCVHAQCVRFHPNSLYIATGSSDRTCRLWDVQKGTCVRVFVGHRDAVTCLAMSPDGRFLASAADDLTINLWDLASGRLIKSMTGHTSSIYSLSFSAESTVLVSGSADATVRVWDVLSNPYAAEMNGELIPGSGRRAGMGGSLGSVTRMSFEQVKGSARRASLVASGLGGGGGGGGGAGGNGGSAAAGGMGSGGVLGEGGKGQWVKGTLAEKEAKESPDLLATLATKRTPVLAVKFTPRNLCLAAGPMQEVE